MASRNRFSWGEARLRTGGGFLEPGAVEGYEVFPYNTTSMSSHECPPDLSASLEATLRFARASGVWVVPGSPRGRENPGEAQAPAGATSDAAARLRAVREQLGECRRCRLCRERTQIVFGVGDPAAHLLFVGEAPGAEEDRKGEPFVGRAGQLLDRMIRSIGLARERVYIANVLKCRPPGNRDPSPDEAETCLPFLWLQVEAMRPRVICALGAHAARNLLAAPDAPLAGLRGRPHRVRGWTVLPTYHPAYLLRNPSAKRVAWGDLKTLRGLLDRED